MNEASSPASAGAGSAALTRVAAAAGLIALTDLTSQLITTLGRWQPELPFWKLAALQTLGTQTTPLVVALAMLLAVVAVWSKSSTTLRGAAIVLAVLGVAALWLASALPEATRIFVDLPGVVEQERLLRGTRQALIALPVLGAWSILSAVVVWRVSRPGV